MSVKVLMNEQQRKERSLKYKLRRHICPFLWWWNTLQRNDIVSIGIFKAYKYFSSILTFNFNIYVTFKIKSFSECESIFNTMIPNSKIVWGCDIWFNRHRILRNSVRSTSNWYWPTYSHRFFWWIDVNSWRLKRRTATVTFL